MQISFIVPNPISMLLKSLRAETQRWPRDWALHLCSPKKQVQVQFNSPWALKDWLDHIYQHWEIHTAGKEIKIFHEYPLDKICFLNLEKFMDFFLLCFSNQTGKNKQLSTLLSPALSCCWTPLLPSLCHHLLAFSEAGVEKHKDNKKTEPRGRMKKKGKLIRKK